MGNGECDRVESDGGRWMEQIDNSIHYFRYGRISSSIQ